MGEPSATPSLPKEQGILREGVDLPSLCRILEGNAIETPVYRDARLPNRASEAPKLQVHSEVARLEASLRMPHLVNLNNHCSPPLVSSVSASRLPASMPWQHPARSAIVAAGARSVLVCPWAPPACDCQYAAVERIVAAPRAALAHLSRRKIRNQKIEARRGF